MKGIFRFIINPFTKPNKILSDPQQYSFFRKNLKAQFAKNKLGIYSLRLLYFLIGVALLADILSNEKPLAAGYKGGIYFPVFHEYAVDLGISKWQPDFQNADWKNLEYEWSVFPPVPYLPQTMDDANVHSRSPFETQQVSSLRWRHWLGTDELGRDVLAGMIHGTRIALTVGLVAMGIAVFLGILLGSLAGYFGDERMKISRAGAVMYTVFFILGIFWGFIARSYELSDALAVSFGNFFLQILFSFLILLASVGIGRLSALPLKMLPFFRKKISFPADLFISRMIEAWDSFPSLLIIISVSALVIHPSIYISMSIIGLTLWTGIARFTRAEMLRIRSLEYIEAAHALGYSEFRVILRHAIPNALSPVLIAAAFGIAAAILIESVLSFLGVGVSAETVTWGSLLAAARQSPSAWWLAIVPGCAIFITVTIFNLLGEALTDALDPKLKK